MGKPDGIAAVILAAGYSSRMGEFKPLMKLGKLTTIAHAIRCFSDAGVKDIRVVVGHRAPEVIEALKPYAVRLIQNPRYPEGMYSSVQEGAGSLEPEVSAFFLLPADNPLVRVSTVQRILSCYHSTNKDIVYPAYKGSRGHPPLISTKLIKEILKGTFPGGLRGLLSSHEQEAADVEVVDEAVLLDMDTPEDYHRLTSYLRGRAVPTPGECLRILKEEQVAEPVRCHCLTVASLAASMVDSINKGGAGLDRELVVAGALLHDLARHLPDHARAGASLIEARGYPRVAEVMASHMDIETTQDQPLSEAEVVYLADKMVRGCSVVSITRRFAAALERVKDDREASRAAMSRLEMAEIIKKKVEKVLGCPVETISPADLQGNVKTLYAEVDVNA